jgi:hypothetical protein
MMRHSSIRAVRLAATVFILALFFAPVALVGTVGASTSPVPRPPTPAGIKVTETNYAVPIEEGGFLTNDHRFLVFNGVLSWGGVYTTVYNGSQVYAAQFVLVI